MDNRADCYLKFMYMKEIRSRLFYRYCYACLREHPHQLQYDVCLLRHDNEEDRTKLVELCFKATMAEIYHASFMEDWRQKFPEAAFVADQGWEDELKELLMLHL